MNRTCLLNAALLLAIPVAVLAQSASQTTSSFAPMSKHELQPLIKSAHSSAEYKQLATYYHHQEAIYRAKAADERAERDRRAKVNAALYQKYPRPVDSSQYRYEAFSADADKAYIQATHFDQLAARTQTQHEGHLPSATEIK